MGANPANDERLPKKLEDVKFGEGSDPVYLVLKPCGYGRDGEAFAPPRKPPRPKPGETPPPPLPPTLVKRSQFAVKLDFTRPNAHGEWPYGKDVTEGDKRKMIEQARDAIILRLLELQCIVPYTGEVPHA